MNPVLAVQAKNSSIVTACLPRGCLFSMEMAAKHSTREDLGHEHSSPASAIKLGPITLSIDVVVAIITNQQEEILIARRAIHKHQGGLWEFPGGKVEPGEDLLDALKREIYEELGIIVQMAEPFMQYSYSYPDKDINLHVWQVTEFTGQAYGKENQPIGWVKKTELGSLPFPEANQIILQRLLA